MAGYSFIVRVCFYNAWGQNEFSALGNVMRREKASVPQLDARKIICQVKKVLDTFIVRILLALHGIVDHGMIRYSDIPELESMPLKDVLPPV